MTKQDLYDLCDSKGLILSMVRSGTGVRNWVNQFFAVPPEEFLSESDDEPWCDSPNALLLGSVRIGEKPNWKSMAAKLA